jgi:hypothetical protein
MLQALLEDRFNLKIHRGTRQVPIYALVVAKGRPKLDAAKKDSCTAPPDFSKGLPPPLRPDQPPPCGAFSPDGKGGTRTFGQTLAGLSAEFSAGKTPAPRIASSKREIAISKPRSIGVEVYYTASGAPLLPRSCTSGRPGRIGSAAALRHRQKHRLVVSLARGARCGETP